jgi:hypothetical protein
MGAAVMHTRTLLCVLCVAAAQKASAYARFSFVGAYTFRYSVVVVVVVVVVIAVAV